MEILSIINHKGGVGKTTTSVNLSAGLSLLGKKVLVIDLDAQANLSYNLGLDHLSECTIYHALRGSIEQLPIYPVQGKENLWAVPAHLSLGSIEIEIHQKQGREFLLKNLIKNCATDYDYIIIDCPPAISLLTLNALIASTEVIIPIEADGFALHGILKLESIIDQIRRSANPELNILGLLITRYDKRKTLSREVEVVLHNNPKYNLLQPSIRTNIALSEASLNRQDIFSYAPHSAGAMDYLELCKNIIHE